MSDQKHMEEPWSNGSVSAGGRAKCITSEGSVIAIATRVDDANRIVACVNALAGIDDPEAFMRDMKLWKKLQEYFKKDDPTFDSVAASIELDEAILEHLKGGEQC